MVEKTTITISKQTYQKLLSCKLAKQNEVKKIITWDEFFEMFLKR